MRSSVTYRLIRPNRPTVQKPTMTRDKVVDALMPAGRMIRPQDALSVQTKNIRPAKAAGQRLFWTIGRFGRIYGRRCADHHLPTPCVGVANNTPNPSPRTDHLTASKRGDSWPR